MRTFAASVQRAGKTLRDSVLHPLTIDEQTVRQAELVAAYESKYGIPPGRR